MEMARLSVPLCYFCNCLVAFIKDCGKKLAK
jgi:hypothetical protein